eukprot:TRINITY_DN2919_c0_g1_i1.p1 TRINITY_DN2919_c0_g1~~TRINITY_DN2919_c0_g1_i1.p1  ORF type:complete len:294 (-),score=42.22 TRINITY_DN2919_c0_g1_i1:66-947(-)
MSSCAVLSAYNYGKINVRLAKVTRLTDHHLLDEMRVQIRTGGDFANAWLDGNNDKILPTDTMKNTVYALANEGNVDPIEVFAIRLADHFLSTQSQIHRVEVTIHQIQWTRLKTDEGKPAPSAWKRGSDEKRYTQVIKDKKGTFEVQSGLSDLVVLRSSGSGFVGYVRDKYTTLKETSDRIFSTSVKAVWKYSAGVKDYNATFKKIRNTLIENFHKNPSPSVQITLWEMGREVVSRVASVEEISLTLPNIHYIPFDMASIGLENRNSVFFPISDPSGYIEGTISRKHLQQPAKL